MHRGYTKRWRKRWDKGYHVDHLLWVMMGYFIDFATYKDKEFPFIWKGALVEMVKLKRGQCFFTFKGLKDFFHSPLNPVSRKMVRRRIKILEKIGFLAHKQGRHYQIVTICNYDKYNPTDKDEEHEQEHQAPINGTSNAHQSATTNNNKNINKYNIYSSNFLKFWETYPRKQGKGQAYRAWKRIKKGNGLFQEILKAVEIQKTTQQWIQDNGKYIPHPSTWLNGRHWEDEIKTERRVDDRWEKARKENLEFMKKLKG